ncbi:SusC/RagA family TonB-linked outer membrane protein [Bacteroidia bacterium]|nr:SusC/RagA family TonB-linked outer membrane protein [Bacteroidia bacterium]
MKKILSKIMVGAFIYAVPLWCAAQDLNISGTVLDNNGDPIVGATVVVKGTTTGVNTGINGDYNIGASADATLIFSFVGMAAKEEAVGGRARVDVVLGGGTQAIDEVVVVGYGSVKRQNLTGAVDQVGGDVLASRPIPNIGAGLQGIIPNLQITPSGNAPGQGASFNIRGYTSLNGGSPLILVDGVVQDPNLVNPQDIESITVLKDASSAAIYGARAAYGVILFTTKSGKKNQAPQVNVSISTATSSPVYVPKYMDSWNYVNYMNLASKNAGGGDLFDANQLRAVKAYYDDPVNNPSEYYDPNTAYDGWGAKGKWTYAGNTDWSGELYKPGGLQNYDISLSGGTDNSRYYLSYGLMNQQGVLAVYDDTYQRHTVSIDLTSDLRKWITVGAKAKYTYGNYDGPPDYSGRNTFTGQSGWLKDDLMPIMPIRHKDGTYGGQGTFTNPFAIGEYGGSDRSKTNDLWVTGKVQIRPLEGLTLNGDYTFNPYSYNRQNTRLSFMEYWNTNLDGGPGGSGEYRDNGNYSPNSIYMENSNDYYQALNAYADYAFKFLDKNNVKITAGYSHEVKTNKSFNARGVDIVNPDLPIISNTKGAQYVGGDATSWAVQGVFGRIHYDFDEKYLVDINGRYDGSSKFAAGKRFAFFPSVAGAWHISHEDFMSSIKNIVSDLKVRASYGSLGNQNVDANFPYLATYGTTANQSYVIGGQRGIAVSAPGLVSSNFTWETVTQWNIGVNYGFLDQRLTGSFDIFSRQTKDMLVNTQPLPGVLGVATPRANAGDLKTTGWELSITYADKVKAIDLDYYATFVLSDAQSEITKYENSTGTLGSFYVGRKIGEIWGYTSNGLLLTDEEVAIANGVADGNGVYPAGSQKQLYSGVWEKGDVKFVDVNGNGVSSGKNTLDDHDDRSIIGNNTPRYQYGITLGAAWKGIDIEIFLQGVGKRDIFPDGRFFGTSSEWAMPMALASNFYREADGFWSENTTGAYLPRPYLGNTHAAQTTSTRYLQDASYLRFKQLSVGYTLPQRWTQAISISKARLYVTGQNIFTWTKLSKIYDPEIVGTLYQTSGTIAGSANPMTYPVAKTWSIGLNVTF